MPRSRVDPGSADVSARLDQVVARDALAGGQRVRDALTHRDTVTIADLLAEPFTHGVSSGAVERSNGSAAGLRGAIAAP